MQPLVNCPERDLGQHGGHEQMDINIPQPFSHQCVISNELDKLLVIRADRHGKFLEEIEYFRSILEISASEFADDKRVTEHLAVI